MTWNNCINNEDSDDLQDASENAEEKKQIRMGKALSGVTEHDTHVFALSHEFYQRGNLLCCSCDFSQQ